MEGSDLEVRMGFRHSGIFNNDLFAHQKDFLSSDDIGNGAIFTCAGLSFALVWHKTSVFVLIHIVVIEMVTIFPWPISSLTISFSKSPKSIHYKPFWEKFSKCNIFSVWCSVYENCSIRNWCGKYFRIIEVKKIVGSWGVVPKERKDKT